MRFFAWLLVAEAMSREWQRLTGNRSQASAVEIHNTRRRHLQFLTRAGGTRRRGVLTGQRGLLTGTRVPAARGGTP